MKEVKSSLVVRFFVACVLVLSLVGGTAFAAGNTAELISSISVPNNYGEIKEEFKGGSGKAVVHIQDAHCNYDAQISISNIIKQLVSENQFNLVALEGAKGLGDTTILRSIPDERIKELIVDIFVRQGDVTGADLASITSEKDMTLFGVENSDLYLKNRDSFLTSLKQRATLNEKISKISWLLAQLKEKTFSEEAKDLFSTIDDYNKDRISLSRYCVYLKDIAEKKNVKWDRYGNYSQIIEIVSLEDSIDFSKIETERLKIVEGLEKKLEKDQVSDLVSQSLYFRLGKISAKKYYNYLNKLAKENKVELKDEINLKTYVKLVNLYDEVNSDKLFFELEQIEGDIKDKVYQTKQEKELDGYFKNIHILSNLSNLKMTRKDLNYFNDHKESFKIDQFVSFIRKEMIRHQLSFPIDSDLKIIENMMPTLEAFYNLALKRDEVMVDNLIAKMDKSNRDKAILVTGGFHSQGILDRLKAKDISYLVVMPKINSIGNTEEVYLNRIGEGVYGAGVGLGMLAPINTFIPMTPDDKKLQQFEKKVANLYPLATVAEGSKVGADNLTEIQAEFITAYRAAKEKQIRAAIAAEELPADTKVEDAIKEAIDNVSDAQILTGKAIRMGKYSYVAIREKTEDGKEVINIYQAVVENNQLSFQRVQDINALVSDIKKETEREKLESTKEVLDELSKALESANLKEANIENLDTFKSWVKLLDVETSFSSISNVDVAPETMAKVVKKAEGNVLYNFVNKIAQKVASVIGLKVKAQEAQNAFADQIALEAASLAKNIIGKEMKAADITGIKTIDKETTTEVDGQEVQVSPQENGLMKVTVDGEAVDADAFWTKDAKGNTTVYVAKALMDGALTGDVAKVQQLLKATTHETIEKEGLDHTAATKASNETLDTAITAAANKIARSISDAKYKAVAEQGGEQAKAALINMLANALNAGEGISVDAVVSKLVGGTENTKLDREMDSPEAITKREEDKLKDAKVLAEGETIQTLVDAAKAKLQADAKKNDQTVEFAAAADGIEYAQANVDALINTVVASKEIDATITPRSMHTSVTALLNMRVENGQLKFADAQAVGKVLKGISEKSENKLGFVTYLVDSDVAALAEATGLDEAEIKATIEAQAKALDLTIKTAASIQELLDKAQADDYVVLSEKQADDNKAAVEKFNQTNKVDVFGDTVSIMGTLDYVIEALQVEAGEAFKSHRVKFLEDIVTQLFPVGKQREKLLKMIRDKKNTLLKITAVPLANLSTEEINLIHLTERTVEVYA
ncbi:hypothetical protein ACFLQ1_00670 [Candidatus Auribacterota bacterium]